MFYLTGSDKIRISGSLENPLPHGARLFACQNHVIGGRLAFLAKLRMLLTHGAKDGTSEMNRYQGAWNAFAP
jgi:hypothetical protein